MRAVVDDEIENVVFDSVDPTPTKRAHTEEGDGEDAPATLRLTGKGEVTLENGTLTPGETSYFSSFSYEPKTGLFDVNVGGISAVTIVGGQGSNYSSISISSGTGISMINGQILIGGKPIPRVPSGKTTTITDEDIATKDRKPRSLRGERLGLIETSSYLKLTVRGQMPMVRSGFIRSSGYSKVTWEVPPPPDLFNIQTEQYAGFRFDWTGKCILRDLTIDATNYSKVRGALVAVDARLVTTMYASVELDAPLSGPVSATADDYSKIHFPLAAGAPKPKLRERGRYSKIRVHYM